MIAIDTIYAFLGTTGFPDDPRVQHMEAAAVDFLERETGRFFGSTESYTEYLRGLNVRNLWLSEEPTAVRSTGAMALTVKQSLYPGSSQTTIASTASDGWLLRGQTQLVRKGGYLWSTGYEYEITYGRGYPLASTGASSSGANPVDIAAPDEVRQKVLEIIAFQWRGGEPENVGITSETIGDYSYSIGALYTQREGLLNAIPGLQQVINHWRLPEVAR